MTMTLNKKLSIYLAVVTIGNIILYSNLKIYYISKKEKNKINKIEINTNNNTK
jgi:hypothetical protein